MNRIVKRVTSPVLVRNWPWWDSARGGRNADGIIDHSACDHRCKFWRLCSISGDERGREKRAGGTGFTGFIGGRWSGKRYGYGRSGAEGDCGNRCALIYDFVVCAEGWCGIVVGDGNACGAIGVRLAANGAVTSGGGTFKGTLELAKGSAPYVVQAWYSAVEGAATLHFLGDTGPELRIMRRSFPFGANIARIGDATCTLQQATS